MKTYEFIRACAIIFCFACMQANGQTNGIVLELLFPDLPLLYMEENSIRLCVRNGSDRPLPLVKSLQNAVRSQIKIDFGLEHGYVPDRYNHTLNSRGISVENLARMADGEELAPEQSYVWEWRDYGLIVYPNLLSDIYNLGVTNISVSLQTGNGEWVSKQSYPITILSEKESGEIIKKAVPVLEATFRNQSTGQSWSMPLNKLTINGKAYLFTAFGARVCALPNGEIPTIQDNPDGSGFTLTFPAAKQRIRYDWGKMRGELDDNAK